MKKFLFFALLLSTLISARADKMDDRLKAEITKRRIAGASVVVIRNDKVIAARGYGMANIEQRILVKPETMFQIASTTKPFTAMSIMMLHFADENLTIIVLTNSKSGEDRIEHAEVLARGIADIYLSNPVR